MTGAGHAATLRLASAVKWAAWVRKLRRSVKTNLNLFSPLSGTGSTPESKKVEEYPREAT
jgi:hypothetical protein